MALATHGDVVEIEFAFPVRWQRGRGRTFSPAARNGQNLADAGHADAGLHHLGGCVQAVETSHGQSHVAGGGQELARLQTAVGNSQPGHGQDQNLNQ